MWRPRSEKSSTHEVGTSFPPWAVTDAERAGRGGRVADDAQGGEASALDRSPQTAQSFLETLATLGILAKEESLEKSRPYYRYSLKTDRITLDLDLSGLAPHDPPRGLDRRIRERKNAGARFVTARGGNAISSVAVWTGDGRAREERKLNLTEAQGAFLYHLPFPGAEPLSVGAIMKKAGVAEARAPEILDIVERLAALGVVEVGDGT